VQGWWHQHERRQSDKAGRVLDKNKQGTGMRRQQRWGGMFVVGRVCVTLTRILVETADWACLFRMVGTTLFSRKERRRATLGLGIFEKHLYLGFALKIFCHLLFNMTNFK
jgi:hypothetical protein